MTSDTTLAGEIDPDRDWRRYADAGPQPVLAAALRTFVDSGYHGTTVRQIASRADVSVPGLYYHYPTKQAMLVDLLDRGMAELRWRSEDALAEAGDDPIARFSRLVECIVLFMTYRRDVGFLMGTEVRSLEPPNRERHLARQQAFEDVVFECVDAGSRAGIFLTRHAREASRAVLTMCQGVTTWFHRDDPRSPEILAEQYVRFALRVVRSQSEWEAGEGP